MSQKSQLLMFYQIRPNKVIDRLIFIELLIRLNRICHIPEYRYIGFGSFCFEDFKIMHRQLGINDLVSLESDELVYKRQLFNCPFECINVNNKSSSEYIAEDFERDKPTIFWLDYSDPKKLREQIEEFCSLIGLLEPKDIVKVTLNANPCTLGEFKGEKNERILHSKRLEQLLNRIGDFLPEGVTWTDMYQKNYPKILFLAMRNAIYKYYSQQMRRFLPLTSSVYADGQQMLTLTGIIIESDEEKKDILRELEDWDFLINSWGEYHRIEIPWLTVKECITLNELLPGKTIEEISTTLEDFVNESNLTPDIIENYKKYYRYFPSYHQIIF